LTILTNEQVTKWNELDTFFKTNSKYYKKIDNGDIIFFIYPCGAGGNFLINLFLDEVDIPVEPNNTYSATDKVKSLRNYNDVTNYRFLKYLNVNDINNIEAIDEIFKNTLANFKNTSYIVSHLLPIIPYFYYKNFDRITTIYIDNTSQKFLTQVLCSIKQNGIEPDQLDDLVRKKCKAPVAKKLKPIIIEQLAVVDHVAIKNILVDYLTIPDNHNFILESNPDEITENLIEVLTKLYNEIPLPPTYTTLSLLDTFPGELVTLDYENLFFNNEDTIIHTLMDVFKSKNLIGYYKKEIKNYHTINLKLVTQFKHNLLLTLNKLQ
tara:strand:- start:1552 stop:2517 length:966 start_codon:yes stop_codon:yes gene_type:complete